MVGYLLPSDSPAPLEGAALVDFLQAWIVGVTGMPGEMVRPFWQPDVPNAPTAGTSWAAVGVTVRPSDDYPFLGMVGDSYTMQRHETMALRCSFYDLGDTGEADKFCALLRDGAVVPQNRDYLRAAGMNLVNTETPVPVPVIVKMRWQYRVDMTVNVRREIQRVYVVPTIAGVRATLYAEAGRDAPIEVDIT